MLRTRILTALVLLAILALAAAISVQALVVLGAVFLALALAEWLRLSGLPPRAAAAAALLAGAAALACRWQGLAPSGPLLQALCALACLAWLAIAALLVRAQRAPIAVAPGLLVALALLLAGVAWLALVDLLQHGPAWTLSVLALVWLADIAAYFSGRAFGVRKLASRISPGKTWAGVWGAVVAVVLLAELASRLWPLAPLWSTRLLLAAPLVGVAVLLVLVALSIVGDLFESLVKRQAGAKDSGRILPGHGGVWDRIDATLPVLPLAVLAQSLLPGGGALG
jgi:phosphatidate cytidylyltransferase